MVERTQKREDLTMTQVHKRFTAEQVKVLFQGYCQGNLSRPDVQEMLGIGNNNFFLPKNGVVNAKNIFSPFLPNSVEI